MKLLKDLLPHNLVYYGKGLAAIRRKTGIPIVKCIKHANVITPYDNIPEDISYARQFKRVCKSIRIDTTFYIYPYDVNTFRVRPVGFDSICSITVDYAKVLATGLEGLKVVVNQMPHSSFKDAEICVIEGIFLLVNRIKKSLPNTDRGKKLSGYFNNILEGAPKDFDEAIQKLLFFNALFWQMDHWHIGLGRLDMILYPYYKTDIESGRISETEAKKMIREMLIVLGSQTKAKSVSLIGDTGQYILLGGIDKDGNTVDNELTHIFIDQIAELKVPDPKLILRVNKNTSNTTWSKSLDCIMTGCGSPLIMNEQPIMANMIKFGYNEEDVWNVGTSACWEPLIIGKSFDQNNPFSSTVAIKGLNRVLDLSNDIKDFDELLKLYKEEFKKDLLKTVHDIRFDVSPLFSLFFDSCIERGKDFTQGGAIYAYHGAQVVSLPNTVNALLAIKEVIFDKSLYSLSELRQALSNNYEGYEDLRQLLINSKMKFGSSNQEVLSLTNDLMQFTGEVMSNVTCNGEKVKVGFSSPNYMWVGKSMSATPDGRKAGEPFAVHISPVSANIDISEILDFASQLNYEGNRINGNVVDFILPSSYVKQQDKLISMLRNACDKGLFEIQLNVLDKATLIDAKAHPEKYPNLIVRVWGFSAYFNDLPEEYKDNLIQRAQTYEA